MRNTHSLLIGVLLASAGNAIAAQDNREGTESDLDYYKFGIGLINASEKLGYVKVSLSAWADEQSVRVIGSQEAL